MTTAEPLEIQKSRGLGDQLNFTFNFIRANFKKLFKAVLVIVGPAMVLTSGLLGYSIFGFYSLDEYGYDPGNGSILMLVVGVLCAIAATILLLAVINEFVILYQLHRGDNFEVEDIWRAVKHDLGRITLTLIGLSAIVLLAYLAMVALIAIGGLFFVFLIFLFFIPLVWVMVPLLMIIPVRLNERDLSFTASISRCFELTKNNWWATFILYMALNMVANFVSTFLYIPMMFVMSFIGISTGGSDAEDSFRIVMVAFMTVILLVSYIASAFPVLGATLQYYNLVEKLEGSGLMGRIAEIGTNDDTGNLDAPTY